MRKKIPLLVVFILIFSACAAPSSALQGTWKLVEYGSAGSMTSAVDAADAALTFADDGTVSGSAGCNSLGGEYEVDGNEVTFGPITSTLMGCEEPLMTQEGAVTQVLSGTAEYEVEGDTLTITNNDMMLVFSK